MLQLKKPLNWDSLRRSAVTQSAFEVISLWTPLSIQCSLLSARRHPCVIYTHTQMGGFIKDTVVKVMALQHLTEQETVWEWDRVGKVKESVGGLNCNPQRQRDGVKLMRVSGWGTGRGVALASDGQLCVPLTSVWSSVYFDQHNCSSSRCVNS